MPQYIYRSLLISISLGLAVPSTAAQIYKCTTAHGTVLFSDSSCPSGTQSDTYQLNSPMTIPALPQNTIDRTLTKQPRKLTPVTVVVDNTPPCGAFDPTERRTQLIREQVTSGMSQAEVERMFGKPISERRRNGNIHAIYRSRKGQQRSVRFDEQGCVP